MKFGVRFPATVPDPEVTSFNLNNPSQPGSFGGVPLFFAKSCPMGTSQCEVDSLHPAPAGQRWVQYRSTNDFMSSPNNSSAQVGFRVTFPAGTCSQFTGKPVALWYSDDSDDRYGRTVNDGFKDNITMTVPALPAAWGAALAIGMLALGALGLRRLRQT